MWELKSKNKSSGQTQSDVTHDCGFGNPFRVIAQHRSRYVSDAKVRLCCARLTVVLAGVVRGILLKYSWDKLKAIGTIRLFLMSILCGD